jgi:hypothetical protein
VEATVVVAFDDMRRIDWRSELMNMLSKRRVLDVHDTSTVQLLFSEADNPILRNLEIHYCPDLAVAPYTGISNISRSCFTSTLGSKFALKFKGCEFAASVKARVSIGCRRSCEMLNDLNNVAAFINTDRFATCCPGQTLRMNEPVICTDEVSMTRALTVDQIRSYKTSSPPLVIRLCSSILKDRISLSWKIRFRLSQGPYHQGQKVRPRSNFRGMYQWFAITDAPSGIKYPL